MASTPIDPEVRALAEKLIETKGASKRAVACMKWMLDKGSVSTDDLNDLGYNHPPRVIGDIRDAGVPVITTEATSPRTGRRMGVYIFGPASAIQEGRVGGRSALPKAFKQALLQRYGSEDRITGAKLDERVLQIDHRVPYRIAGDVGLADHDVEAYMLLDASSQRAKSWSCENCPNMLPQARNPEVCRTCFWAYPEEYLHVATHPIRRTDVTWQDADVAVHDKLKQIADASGVSVPELLRQLGRQRARAS